MAKRYFGTYDAHRTLRSAMGNFDTQPNADQLELMHIARAADVRNSIALELYEHEQMIARMRSRLDKLKNA